jgi:ribonuclease-3
MKKSVEKLAAAYKGQLEKLEQTINYTFKDRTLLLRALTHSSYAYEQGIAGQDNETLEFLGDAVLDLAIGSFLFQRFPDMKEGELTRMRAALVNESGLAERAKDFKLGDFLFLGKGEDASNGRQKSSILSCAYEALLGAVFHDSNYDTVRQLIENHFAALLVDPHATIMDADTKSRLQELLQEKFNQAPSYTVIKEEGPDHAKIFTVAVIFQERPLGHGTATNKKEAEQKAAAEVLKQINSGQLKL